MGQAVAGALPPQEASRHHMGVDADAYPWSAVGKLFNSVGGACTAAVIAPDRVLTAAHCLYAFRTRRFLPPDAIHFLLGYARGDYRIHARVARYRVGRGYDPARERDTASSDWAVLELAEPLPPGVRPLALASALPDIKTTLVLGGFAQDRAYLMTADMDCHVTGLARDGKLIFHDCVIAHGDSGAPLLSPTAEPGRYRCLGVTVGLLQADGRRVGFATPVSTALLADAVPMP